MRLIKSIPVLFLVLALVACGGYGSSKKKSSEGTETTIGGVMTKSHGTKDVSGETGKVEIEMYDNYFEPTVLKGKPGQKVTLELKNEGQVTHNLSISGQSINKDVAPGDEAEADVTFPQSGTLAFYCKYHKSTGMVGALELSSYSK